MVITVPSAACDKKNAAGTGVAGGCSGEMVCGGTLQALYEAASQVGWVLTPVGL